MEEENKNVENGEVVELEEEIKTNFHMVGDMSIPCSIILSGVQKTEKRF